MFKNNGTTTVVLKSPQTTTLSVGRIAIDNNITLPPKNVAGHEAFHFWRGLDGRESCIETVLENLDFTSETFQEYQSSISRVMFQGEVDLSNQWQFDQLMEEIFAYISGDIHEGTNDAAMRPMFRDFDAVQAAWERLVEENRGGTTRSRYSLKEDRTNGADGQERQFLEGAGSEEAVCRFYAEAEGRGQTVRVFRRSGEGGQGSRPRLGRFAEVSEASTSEIAAQTKAELDALGVPAFIHSGDLEVLNGRGETLAAREDAATINRAAVGIANSIQVQPRETTGHEEYHFWKWSSLRQSDSDLVHSEIEWNSPEFFDLYDRINKKLHFYGIIET